MREHRLTEIFETFRQPLVNGVATVWISRFGNPLIPGFSDRGQNDGFDRLKSMQFGLRKHSIPPTDHQYDSRPGRDLRKVIHLVQEMRTFTILTVVLTRPKPVRQFFTKAAQVWFLLANGKLIQRVEQIGSGELAFEVVFPASGFQRVMQYDRACIIVKCDKAGTFVIDD